MEKLCARRIQSLKDVNFIVHGIKQGIENKVYSDLTLMETLRLISGKDVTFYMFLSGYSVNAKDILVPVGFGAIRNDREVYKVFVTPQARGHGFGTRISLWIKQLILKHGYIPVCWIKEVNVKWSKTIKKQGMTEMESGFSWKSKKYMLTKFDIYIKAIEEHKVTEITYIPTVKKKPRIVMPIHRIG